MAPPLEADSGADLEVTFSSQDPSTDTIALDEEDRPFRIPVDAAAPEGMLKVGALLSPRVSNTEDLAPLLAEPDLFLTWITDPTQMKLSTDAVKLNVIHASVGGITESDVMLASASNAIIIGFNIRPEPKATALAESEGVDLRLYNIIYNAIDEVRAAMEGLLEPTLKERVTGRAEVRQTFSVPKVGMIAGSYVLDGTIGRSCAGVRVTLASTIASPAANAAQPTSTSATIGSADPHCM